MKSDHYKKLQELITELRSSTVNFFKVHQDENIILEYKATFEYDTAMALCPLAKIGKISPINEDLSLKILKTLVAFANTYGGLLIFGIAEENNQIIDKKFLNRCISDNKEKLEGNKTCLESHTIVSCLKIDRLFTPPNYELKEG